ncbi:MAG: metallophosphoesterase [Bacteroidales bacterium]|nr:metallophosphoesterase [Bacteroidales bacterium]
MTDLFTYSEAKSVVVCGDIHGDFKGVVFKLCIQYGLTDTLLIVAGDCGFGFEKPGYYELVYNQVAGRLRKANKWVAFVRGNHDNPSFFNEQKIAFKRWRTIPDYGVIQACGHNILCVGGAVSVDRRDRKEENARKRSMGHVQTAVWWEDEPPVFCSEKIAAIPPDIRIDAVISHSAPSFCEPTTKTGLNSWAALDPELYEDTDRERKTMDEIFNAIRGQGHPVERWYFGHFHYSWVGTREDVLFSMLDIEQFKEIRP